MFKKIKKYLFAPKTVYTKAKNKIRCLYQKLHTKHLNFDVAELFYQHNGENDFLRYDMIVRLLAVENYFNINDFGFDMYSRMQGARVKPEYVSESVERFKKLIASYETKGYNNASEIELDSQLHLIDGSHRMALAMYYDIKTINAKVRTYQVDVFYSIEWFKINGFSDRECEILRNRYEQLKAHYQNPFTCIIWNPATAFYDKIIKDLSLFGKIINVEKIDLNELNYKKLVREVFSIKDVEKRAMDEMLSNMSDGQDQVLHICIVSLLIEQPDYRWNKSTKKIKSKKCEIIKSVVNNAYKSPTGEHCIALDIADNIFQSQHFLQLADRNLNKVN